MIPADVLAECCQLVKQNSIQGCKAATVDIVYTMWTNLKKSASMEVGQVGFHKQKEVRKVKAVAKANEALKRISKTQVESHPDLESQRKEFDRRVAKEAKRKLQVRKPMLLLAYPVSLTGPQNALRPNHTLAHL